MLLPITHDKYTHVEVRGYRKRVNGETLYYVVVAPIIRTVENGMVCVTTEAYTGYRMNLVICKRASNSAECDARELASYLVPETIFTLEGEYGFETPSFDANLLTFTVC